MKAPLNRAPCTSRSMRADLSSIGVSSLLLSNAGTGDGITPPASAMGRSVFQIGCYMTEVEIAALESYAARLELTRTAIFSLAVQQELRAPRLQPRHAAIRPNAPGGKGSGARRVTFHMRSKALKDAFTIHAKTRGYGSDEAAWTVLRNEIRDEALCKALAFG